LKIGQIADGGKPPTYETIRWTKSLLVPGYKPRLDLHRNRFAAGGRYFGYDLVRVFPARGIINDDRKHCKESKFPVSFSFSLSQLSHEPLVVVV